MAFLLQRLEGLLSDFGPVVTFANDRDFLAGKKIAIQSERAIHCGIASGIGENGELLLREESGYVRQIISGTILEIG